MLRIGSVVMGVGDVARASAFWMRALDYVPREEPEDDWVVLVPAAGSGPQLSLGLSETPVQEYPRVHLDLYAGTRPTRPRRWSGCWRWARGGWTGTTIPRTPTSWCSRTPRETASA